MATQEAIAPLFEVKASGPNGGGLYVKEVSQAPITLPVFGEAMMLGDARLTPDFLKAHQGRVLKTPWFVKADEAEKVSTECVALFIIPPPPPSPATDVIACVSTTYCLPALCSTGAQASFGTRFGDGAHSPPVFRWSALAAPESSSCGTGPGLRGAIRTRRLPGPLVQRQVPETGRRRRVRN